MNADDRTNTAPVPSDPEVGAGAQRPGGDGVRRATGRARHEWFALLDEWGAGGRQYREIADWLTGEHAISSWWAQKLIVEYEEARGLRPPGVRPDGTFEVSASKTVAAPIERAFEAFVEADMRDRWLPGVALRERTSRRPRSVRFDWGDGETRVAVTFAASGDTRTQVAVQHERLPDVRSAGEMKAYWRERLAALRSVLES
jgi:uncharacterized protein YndB with AHSA1/START domain